MYNIMQIVSSTKYALPASFSPIELVDRLRCSEKERKEAKNQKHDITSAHTHTHTHTLLLSVSFVRLRARQ